MLFALLLHCAAVTVCAARDVDKGDTQLLSNVLHTNI